MSYHAMCASYHSAFQGVGVGFYSGRVETLADDFAALKPTIVFGVPRVFSRIYDA